MPPRRRLLSAFLFLQLVSQQNTPNVLGELCTAMPPACKHCDSVIDNSCRVTLAVSDDLVPVSSQC